MASDRPKIPPQPLVRAVESARAMLAVAFRKLVPGHIALMELTAAGWITQAIHAAAALGIADELAAGPRSSAELAAAVGADEDALRRLLRLLISHGIFTQRRDGRYALTPMARALRRDADVSLRDAVLFFGSPGHRDHWSHLVDAVRTGKPVGEELDGMPFFDYVQSDRELGELFDRAMTSISTLAMEPLFAAYDFGRYETIVDVGGGEGTLLTEILHRAPRSRGILFDLPEVVESAPARLAELGLADRCSVESGSFFDTVPKGGDAYILKHIVHDWAEPEAGHILSAVRAAMTPDARLLIIELVVPEHAGPHPSKYIDLEMLVNAGGRERTEAEYREFLARHGFTLTRLVPTVSPNNVLEARPS
ncbi:acetylserotonin O-methyltransferase [Nocardia sp. NBC_01730]|uniref:methyltransferase n=1 Tax=Nocardia sp. NBC_01730 TaxID=2975998 RepID=UPI002E0FB7D1|nr:acetylserotonin O-methyltransferase [Nocardia sp. NBC_01730]